MALLGAKKLRPLSSPYLSDLCNRINTLEQNARENVLMWTRLQCFCVGGGFIYGITPIVTGSGDELEGDQIIKIDPADGAVVQIGPVIDTTSLGFGDDDVVQDCFLFGGELFVELEFGGGLFGDTLVVYQVFDAETLEYLRGPTFALPEDTVGDDDSNGKIWVAPQGLVATGLKNINPPGHSVDRRVHNFVLDPEDFSVTAEEEIEVDGAPEPSVGGYPNTLYQSTLAPGMCTRYIGPILGNWFTTRIGLAGTSNPNTRFLIKISTTAWPSTGSLLGKIGDGSQTDYGAHLRFGGRVVHDISAIFAQHGFDPDGENLGRISPNVASPATVIENFFLDKDQGQPLDPFGEPREASLSLWNYDDGKLYVLASNSAPTVVGGDAIIVLDAVTMEEQYRIEGNVRRPYETLTEWFVYGPGQESDPENSESVGTFPGPNAFLEFDDKPFRMHGGVIRDMRLAIDAVCVYYKNGATGNQWKPPGSAESPLDHEDPVPDCLYTVAVNDARSHYWNWVRFADPPAGDGDRMVVGWAGISFFEMDKMIKELEESETP